MKHWHETRAVLDRLAELRRAGRRAALATVVRVRGSAYRHEGAKLLVAEDGSTVGNVSGGGLEQDRSEEHTSELQSRLHLVCRLLLEKKKNRKLTPRRRR